MSNSTQNKCPFCKSELVSLILPSNPPQYKTYCPNCEKYKVSNSTQNDEIEVDGETYTKWDTQNDEIKQMERAINEGFAESEKFLKGMRSPFDKSSTQNDHETHTACIERIKKEGASATCCHCNPHDGCTLEMKPTQNDWYDHAVKNPGFKSGLNALKNDTQNDWADKTKEKVINILGYDHMLHNENCHLCNVAVNNIVNLLADARREVIDSKIKEIDKMKVNLINWESRPELYKDFELHNKTIDDVLATLRKEEYE